MYTVPQNFEKWLLAAFVAIMVGIVAIPATLASQVPQQPSVQDAFAAKLDELGQCNAERGTLQQFQSRVMKDRWVPQAQVIAQFEKANPGQTLSSDMKVISKSVDTK